MRLLLIEDATQLAGPIARELRAEYGHEVTCARDPLEARVLGEQFDVVVVDLLFEHLSREFDARRLARQVSLTRDRLLISGLSAVDDFTTRQPASKVVLWTSGEANRHLHLFYAYDELRVRAFCSKSSGTGKADVLNAAIEAAAQGKEYVDGVLGAYVKPSKRAPTLSSTLLRSERHRAIWRAVALGAHSRDEIDRITGLGRRTIGNLMPELLANLVELRSDLQPGSPLTEVVRFAGSHWEFFLDDAVRSRYP
jgi:DNA-binding NarL/FixJ family response regulator